MKHTLPLILCTALAASLNAATEKSQPAPAAPKTISVSGCAIGYFQPDAILWTLSPQANGKTLAETREACEKQVKVLLDGCAKRGIQGVDVTLGRVSVHDNTIPSDGAIKGGPERFTVSRTIMLCQRDTISFQDMLSYLSTSNTGKVNYRPYCSRVDAITRETLLRATKAAKDKAEAMAAALNTKLGPVLSISEFAPAETAVTPENILVDDSSRIYGSDAEKISISVYATFELN